MSHYQLAQINIALARGAMDSELMKIQMFRWIWVYGKKSTRLSTLVGATGPNTYRTRRQKKAGILAATWC